MIHLLPLTIPWLLGAAMLLLDGRKRWVSLLGTAGLATVLALDVLLLVRMGTGGGQPYELVTGRWPAGVGIRLQIDALALFFASITAAISTAVLWRETLAGVRSQLFPALILLMTTGLHGAFFTGDLFNFYVFFELSVVSSFALAAYGYGRAEVRGALIYVSVNLVGSVLFLTGVAMLYHATGTLDLHQLATRAVASDESLVLPATLLFVALSIKLGLFPFHGWVPVLYSHARPTVVAALSGGLVNIGAYGLLRLGHTMLDPARRAGADILVYLGLLAALYGGVLALQRRRPAELAAYLSVVHAGYIVFALGIGGPQGTMAILLTVLAGSLDKSTMFLALTSSGSLRSVCALVGACSAAGLPLTLGFLSKAHLLRASLEVSATPAAVVLYLLSGVLTIAAALRFWILARVEPRQALHPVHEGAPLGLVGLVLVNIVLGSISQPVVELTTSITDALVGGAP